MSWHCRCRGQTRRELTSQGPEWTQIGHATSEKGGCWRFGQVTKSPVQRPIYRESASWRNWSGTRRGHGDDLAQLNRPATACAHHRPRRVAGAVVLACAAAVTIALATTLVTLYSPRATTPRQTTTSSAPHSTTAPRWTLVGDVSPSWHAVGSLSNNPGLSLACPSVETCFAAAPQSRGGVGLSAVEVTNDGGRTWSSSKLPVALLGLAVPLLGQTRESSSSAARPALRPRPA